MHFFRHSHHALRRTLAVLLIGGLLMIQALGLLHGVVHAGGLTVAGPAGVQTASATQRFEARLFADDSKQATAHHSCADYDAATLPALLHTPLFSIAVLESRHCPAFWLAYASWHAPFHSNFSSRAPPLN